MTPRRDGRPGWPYKKEFACHRCGNCCRGEGFVELTAGEIERAAVFLSITPAQFIETYCHPGGGETHFLRDQEDELASCIFLFEDEKGLAGCRIHEAKPDQCREFPFIWRPRNVLTYCDGMRALEGLPPVGKRGISDP
jgi:Fe-S-cluster containining protein